MATRISHVNTHAARPLWRSPCLRAFGLAKQAFAIHPERAERFGLAIMAQCLSTLL